MEVVSENKNEVGKVSSNAGADMRESVVLKLDGEIGWLELDLKGEKVNKFSTPVMLRIKEVLEEIKSNASIKVLVVVSKKKSIYIAGADINEIKAITTEEEFLKAVEAGQGIMNEFEDLKIPVVAAIHGACVGGGCEFVMSCDYRIASDDKSTRIGLPETSLGIIPGFGGCVRLPRIVGIQQALPMILKGSMGGIIDMRKAKKIGLVDEVFPAEIFEEKVKTYVQKILKNGAKKRKKTHKPKGVMNKMIEGPLKGVAFKKATEGVMKQTHGHYPAVLEAIKVIKDTYGVKNRDKAMKREAKGFIKVAVTDVSKNLINLFFMTEDVKKASGVVGKEVSPRKINHLSVLGAGTMGGGIAQLAADKGIMVRMKDLTNEALAIGFKAASAIWSKKLKRRRLTKFEYKQKMDRLSGGLDYAGFGITDLVIEAIVEDMNIKKAVIAETAKNCKDDAIIATNTSSLRVNEMAEAHPRPENFVGMHFFNPVHRMPLVEVIRGEKTSDEVTATIYELSKRMGKIPVVVKDAPGFLVNRLLLPWLAEAMFLLDDGMDVVKVDRMYTHKFGMPMGPYRLMDEVGLDVCVKVLKIFRASFGERIQTSPILEKLNNPKRMGKKSNLGFYKYGGKKRQEFDQSVLSELGLGSRTNPLSEEECIKRGIYAMINEAARALLEDKIVDTPEEVDLAMIMGTGFPPFRGGLLRYADSVGIKNIVSDLEVYESKYGLRFKPAESLVKLAQEGGSFY